MSWLRRRETPAPAVDEKPERPAPIDLTDAALAAEAAANDEHGDGSGPASDADDAAWVSGDSRPELRAPTPDGEVNHIGHVETGETGDLGEPVEVHVGATDDSGLVLATVTTDLAASESGIEFVYRSLGRLRERAGATDVMVIVDEPPLGRQVFRVDRDPATSDWARELIRTGAPGLHATPSEVEPTLASSVASLCSLAVRLDVARHDSLHDPLTGALNRRAFDDLLAAACGRSERYGWTFTLVLIDLDRFKNVNDRLGHAAGDATLQAVGAELRGGLRVGDVAARIGGDEFALLLPNAHPTDVPELVARLERAVDEAVPDARISFAVGAASAPNDSTDCQALYRLADKRLYEVKRAS